MWTTQRFKLSLQQPIIMGIVNVTPDSFSDGGRHFETKAAIEHAKRLCDEGADILDLGAESTRPGSKPVGAEEEWSRLAPVLKEVLTWKVPISVDTYKPFIMQQSLDCGADIINDVWGLRWSHTGSSQPAVTGVQVLAAYQHAGVCLMHMHGEPVSMQLTPMTEQGVSCVQAVKQFLKSRIQELQAAGVGPDRVVVDPGIGFGKTPEQNLLWLQNQQLEEDLGCAWLAGWSRKSTLGRITQADSPELRMPASLAVALLSLQAGAKVLRVHDVAQTRQVLQVWQAAKSVTIST
ncbi:MAG: dihydropteroate synthase [Pseudomonadota bacterium]|jgi:dihydropteroate synthase